MKPLTLFGLLVLAAMVHSVPANSKDQEMETEQIATLDDTADTGMDMNDENTDPSDGATVQQSPTATSPLPALYERTEFYKNEVNEYFEEQAQLIPPEGVNIDAIYHGDTVALQSFMKNRWLGCSQSNCELAPCPKMEMAGSDWTNCQGEVFQIYRAAGQGTVRVGDLVAFYFPQSEGNWLGCAGSSCKKATCPGNPSIAHGFSTADKWHKCGGEVFGIYAKGKANGEIVNSDDDISLFYVNQKGWLAVAPDAHANKQQCLGNTRPPPYSAYDNCAYETLHIWKKEY